MKIIISCGDLNGIGVEALIKSFELIKYYSKDVSNIDFYLASNSNSIKEYIQLCKLNAQVIGNKLLIEDYSIEIIDIHDYFPLQLGKLTSKAGAAAYESIVYSAKSVLDGKFDAILTLPISKEAIYLAGVNFSGHTEILAEICHISHPLMILFDKNIRVALATIHIPLKEVHYELTCSKIITCAKKFNHSLRSDFGIGNPKIAVLSLNPHAGENGKIGHEENEIIIPAIQKLKAMDIDASGPFASDGFFAYEEYKNFDGIISMYHDQGLIPLKLLSKGAGVNFTAGLPIVRTSPDHGTGYQIAGKNLADAQSTLNAIFELQNIVLNRKKGG